MKLSKLLATLLTVTVALLIFSNPALAQDGGAAAAGGTGLLGLGAGLAVGLAALGSGIGQGRHFGTQCTARQGGGRGLPELGAACATRRRPRPRRRRTHQQQHH